MKLITSFILMMISASVWASPRWIGPFEISAINSWEHQGKTVLSVISEGIEEVDDVVGVCGKSEQSKMVSYWLEGQPDLRGGQWLALLMAANAGGSEVMLLVDPYNCSSFGGAYMSGVMAVEDEVNDYVNNLY
ncbi:hypothetical protein [Candidatus Sororendozoicomonas aggregata]|uniref:hypothetical protein n=1 Tax=Candidatus Sororendozoicomonas aggregata TaxID=3073239 RepID=UPI002ED661D9